MTPEGPEDDFYDMPLFRHLRPKEQQQETEGPAPESAPDALDTSLHQSGVERINQHGHSETEEMISSSGLPAREQAAGMEKAPRNHPSYELSEIVKPDEFRDVAQGKFGYTQLHFLRPKSYATEVLTPIAEKLRFATQDRNRPGNRDSEKSSFNGEMRQWHHMGAIAEQLGPQALSKFVLSRLTGRATREYDQRIYRLRPPGIPHGSTATHWGSRSAVEIVQTMLEDERAMDLHERPTVEELHEMLEYQRFNLPVHPKEALLDRILRETPHLQHGGRVIVTCDDRDTADHLIAKLETNSRVGSVISGQRAALKAGGTTLRKQLTSATGVLEGKENKLSVVVVTHDDLKKLKSTCDVEELQGALLVIYHLQKLAGSEAKFGGPRTPPENVPAELNQNKRTAENRPAKDKMPSFIVNQAILLDDLSGPRTIAPFFSVNYRKRGESHSSPLF